MAGRGATLAAGLFASAYLWGGEGAVVSTCMLVAAGLVASAYHETLSAGCGGGVWGIAALATALAIAAAAVSNAAASTAASTAAAAVGAAASVASGSGQAPLCCLLASRASCLAATSAAASAALAASVDAERTSSFASSSAAGSTSTPPGSIHTSLFTPPGYDAEPAAAPAVPFAAGSGDRGRSLAAAADNGLSARRLLSGAEPSPRTRPGASNLRPPPPSTAARRVLPSPSPSLRPPPHHTTTRPRLTGQASSAVSSPRGQRAQ